MRILILAPYPPGQAPSQRFRFEQYLPALQQRGWRYDYEPFISAATWRILHLPGHFVQKAMGMMGAFFRRIRLLLRLSAYDVVFIHREAAHIGPPVLEWLIARVFGKKIIYDFDDAIWLPNYSAHNRMFHRLKSYWKVPFIIRWSAQISAGNDYLAGYARRFNPHAAVIPTTIDLAYFGDRLKDHREQPLVIGWTGTLTTLRYLYPLLPVLERLEQRFAFELHIIANEDPGFGLKSFRFIRWKKETEVEDLLRFHIGLMPLTDDVWAQGKCGFKALQYMSLGIPPVVSPVGVNTVIVQHGLNGMVCNAEAEWEAALERLLSDAELRAEMGRKARTRIEEAYSVEAITPHFLSLFERVAGGL